MHKICNPLDGHFLITLSVIPSGNDPAIPDDCRPFLDAIHRRDMARIFSKMIMQDVSTFGYAPNGNPLSNGL